MCRFVSGANKIATPLVWAVWLAIVSAVLLLNAIIPPGQSPDENSHLARAYLLARGQVFLDDDPSGSGGAIDQGLLRFNDIFHDVGTGGKLDSALVEGVVPYLKWTGVESRRVYAGTGYYFPIIYVPQAVALAIGLHLRLSIEHSYMLARALVFLVSAGLIALSIAMSRPSFVVLALLATPMVMFQMVSATIDGLSIALCMLSLSCFLSLLGQEPGEEGLWRFICLCVTVFVLASSRAHALPMVLLPFVIAWHKKSRPFLWAAVATLVLSIAWTLFALLTVKDLRIPREVSSGQALKYYLLRPWRFAHILGETLAEKWRYYRDTFIGTLGYLNIYLPAWYQGLASGVLLLLALLSLKIRCTCRAELFGRLTLLVTSAASCLMVFLALLVTWTPFPTKLIDGVQGRYFYIPALLLAYAISGMPAGKGRLRTGSACLFAFFVMLGIGVTSKALLTRYWLHGRYYSVADATPQAARQPLVVGEDTVVSATYHAPASGSLYSVAFELGTYFGKANGDLAVRLCGSQCVNASIDVSGAADNEFAYIGFDKPLPVSRGERLTLAITLSNSSNAVALWACNQADPDLAVQVNGRAVDLVPLFRAAIQ